MGCQLTATKCRSRRPCPDVTIAGILKSGPGYEIGLSDRLILKFNLPGQFKSVVMKNE